MALNYADLVAEVEREKTEKSLPFVAKDGKTVLLRPFLLLGETELKTVQVLLKKVGDEEADSLDRLAAIDNILVAVADKKDSLKKSLADLPPSIHSRIFNEWIKATNAGEASA
ncbi:phage tail assembly protein [Nonomuraea jabiensis]|uniref:phage tail assembly protein n=1 Tax=Nonomuraea jabiensis TaxID=882448 RepID=UPI003D72ED42